MTFNDYNMNIILYYKGIVYSIVKIIVIKFMKLVMLPECGGYDLNWSDKLRKCVAKKSPADFEKLEKEFLQNAREREDLHYEFCNYVWKVLVSMSKGYGFNMSHTLAYSLVGLQEMNLAYKYPSVYWNTSCLIADSGGIDDSFDDSSEEEDDDEDNESATSSKKKKATKYGKIASAIGRMRQYGIEVSPPSINTSTYTFSPDEKNNIIRYGLKGISKVGEDIVQNIITKRPFTSLDDFCSRVNLNKPQMVNLIKSGAFDEFGDRQELMWRYIFSVSDTKSRLTLQNMSVLLKYNVLPKELELEIKVFNFNKYLKLKCKKGIKYYLQDYPLEFFTNHFDQDYLEMDGPQGIISIKDWEKLYKKAMDPIRNYLKDNQQVCLEKLNNAVTQELYDKYCEGSYSKWEMDSVGFYSHEHELSNISEQYNVDDYYALPEEPEVDRIITIKGREIPILKLNKIAGTVLDKDKTKKVITLLTTTGVVSVKVWQSQFVKYDKQISQIVEDGKKHVLEKSWFSRGNKLFITGIRRDDMFIPKIYKSTGLPSPFALITEIHEDGTVAMRQERIEEE